MKCWKDYVIEAHKKGLTYEQCREISKKLQDTYEYLCDMKMPILLSGTFADMKADVLKNLLIIADTTAHFHDEFKHCGKEYNYKEI